MWDDCLVNGWSKTQSTIALSYGEAKLAAVVKGATEALGLQAIVEDFGIPVGPHLRSDATAAIGMVKREGLGKVRHLATADLWIQQKVRRGHIKVSEVPGKENPSDMITKGLEGPDIDRHMQTIMAAKASGRHRFAPHLD